ncbi:hypothetical protein [Sellimonas intestinalis]|uniref:hypothetical protein n=1 Tax=Sellimonas intestinalis TaxID=1653434 RepID=UPI00399B3E7E
MTNTPAGQWRCVIGHTDTFCLYRAGRRVRHDAGFYENSGATTTQPPHRRGCLWATTCRQDNDTPLQPQSER